MPLDPLKIAKESLGKAIETEKRNRKLLESIGPAVIDALQPILQGLKEAVSLLRVDVTPIVEVNPEIKIPEIRIPDIKVPDIYVPEIVVPEPRVTVNVPPIKIPEIIMPEEMNVRGWVSLMGVDLNNPLPVQLRDAKGNPVNLFENLTQIVGGGGGGNMRGFIQIKGVTGSTGADLLNADNRLRVSVETGGSGLTDSELRASAVPVAQVSGASWSVSVSGSTGTVGVVTIDPDGNPTYASSTSGLTDTELRASSVPTAQVSGANWSVNLATQPTTFDVKQVSGSIDSVSIVSNIATLDVKQVSGSVDSVVVNSFLTSLEVNQVSGAVWSVSVNDAFRTTVASSLINADDRLRVSLETGGSGLTDAELRASGVPVSQVSGATWSVSVNDAFRTTVTSNLINADDRLRVSLETGGSGLTDAELRATAVPVSQLSGAVWSTNLATALDLTIDSISVAQVSGANYTVNLPASSLVHQVSGANWSVNVALQDFALEVKQVSGSNNSVYITGSSGTTVVVGDIISDAADTGEAPVKFGGIARTANPTAVAANDRVSATFDDLGRQLVRPVQVRDLIATAYVAKTSGSTFGTETTLLAATAAAMFDLIYVIGTNDSDAAISCDFRGVTAGNVLMTIRIPANGTAGIATPIPLPQTTSDTGNAWTIDLPDVTGTNVAVSALFSKEV